MTSNGIQGHIKKNQFFFDLFFVGNLIVSKLEMNNNIIKTQCSQKIKHDLKTKYDAKIYIVLKPILHTNQKLM